jgi:histidine ammonia-lyase
VSFFIVWIRGKDMSILQLTGEGLTIEKIQYFLGNIESTVEITPESYQRLNASRTIVKNIIRDEKTIYDITTGFGLFSDVLISKEKTSELQANLIRSHCCGVGAPFHQKTVLVMMILRLNTLLKGYSGVTPALCDQLKLFINQRIIPKVPEQGSLGASGDLAPLSHIAITLMGEGEVYYKGDLRPTEEVLDELGIQPICLGAKEGLALINGTQPMNAQGVLNYIEANYLVESSLWIAAPDSSGSEWYCRCVLS